MDDIKIRYRDELTLNLYAKCLVIDCEHRTRRPTPVVTGIAEPISDGTRFEVHVTVQTHIETNTTTYYNDYPTMRSFVEELAKLSPPLFIRDLQAPDVFHLVPSNVVDWVDARYRNEQKRSQRRRRVLFDKYVYPLLLIVVSVYLPYLVFVSGQSTDSDRRIAQLEHRLEALALVTPPPTSQPTTAPATKPTK